MWRRFRKGLQTCMARPAKFSATTRAQNLRTLAAESFDVLVIGGGITGAGVARDAALRGLRVALVERRDFAIGTSSRSSKLIHGGLRYLAQGDVGLVHGGGPRTPRPAPAHPAPDPPDPDAGPGPQPRRIRQDQRRVVDVRPAGARPQRRAQRDVEPRRNHGARAVAALGAPVRRRDVLRVPDRRRAARGRQRPLGRRTRRRRRELRRGGGIDERGGRSSPARSSKTP